MYRLFFFHLNEIFRKFCWIHVVLRRTFYTDDNNIYYSLYSVKPPPNRYGKLSVYRLKTLRYCDTVTDTIKMLCLRAFVYLYIIENLRGYVTLSNIDCIHNIRQIFANIWRPHRISGSYKYFGQIDVSQGRPLILFCVRSVASHQFGGRARNNACSFGAEYPVSSYRNGQPEGRISNVSKPTIEYDCWIDDSI